jgi:hypothetical protein
MLTERVARSCSKWLALFDAEFGFILVAFVDEKKPLQFIETELTMA